MSRSARFLGAWFVASVALVMIGAASAGAALGGGPWSPPVSGPVVRGFDPPDTVFGAGHLGVDFAAVPGTPARAAGDGVVAFAGRVGTGLHVVVRHPGAIRTTVSFLAAIAVVVGQAVRRGAILGTTGGTGPGHPSGVVHFGVRVGATYIDPMLLFAPPDLAAVVHLAEPRHGAVSAPPVASGVPAERASLVAGLRIDDRTGGAAPGWWNDPPVATPASHVASRVPAGGTVATSPAPGSSGAVPEVVGTSVAAAAIGGVALRRRRRRGPVDRRGPPTTLQPGPGAPGLRNLARLCGGRGTEITDDTRP